MWPNPLSRRALARHQARMLGTVGPSAAPPCDYYVGSDCCNLSSSGVWVCDAGPGGGACTVSMPVGDIPRCSDMFEKDFYTPEAPLTPRFVNPAATEFGVIPPGSYMGFPSQRRAIRRAARLRRSRNPASGYTYPFPVFVPYGAPQPQTQFGSFNWPGLEWVGAPLYRLG